MPILMPITTRLGTNSKRRNDQRSSRNVERTIILMGLLTGNRKDAVSARADRDIIPRKQKKMF